MLEGACRTEALMRFALEIVNRVHRSFFCLFDLIFSFSCLVEFMDEREAVWSLPWISCLSCSQSYKRTNTYALVPIVMKRRALGLHKCNKSNLLRKNHPQTTQNLPKGYPCDDNNLKISSRLRRLDKSVPSRSASANDFFVSCNSRIFSSIVSLAISL